MPGEGNSINGVADKGNEIVDLSEEVDDAGTKAINLLGTPKNKNNERQDVNSPIDVVDEGTAAASDGPTKTRRAMGKENY